MERRNNVRPRQSVPNPTEGIRHRNGHATATATATATPTPKNYPTPQHLFILSMIKPHEIHK